MMSSTRTEVCRVSSLMASTISLAGATTTIARLPETPVKMDKIRYTFPIRCYVERTADAGRESATINGLVDAFVTAYRNGLTYGGTVAEGRITAWNTDLYAEVGQSRYRVVEFTLFVLVLDDLQVTSGNTLRVRQAARRPMPGHAHLRAVAERRQSVDDPGAELSHRRDGLARRPAGWRLRPAGFRRRRSSPGS